MESQGTPNTAKRPRLSLQIRTSCLSPSKGLRGGPVNPSDPTAFNTLSNAYVTAIERSSTAQSEPITAINTLQAFSIETPAEPRPPRVFTPYVANYPETPLTALSNSPSQMEIKFPSTMTATPPLSATADASPAQVFTFSSSSSVTAKKTPATLASPVDGRAARRRIYAGLGGDLPYTHPRSLHSILRNSPLPPRTAIPPPSPRRQSLRLQEKAAKKVEYNNPLTQDIITNTYVKSHIDLLTDDASPNTPPLPTAADTVLDVALSFTANELRDGGQTPGPFEETRRRMAGLAVPQLPSPVENGGGPRKRKRTEKKRQWRWTIGQEDGDEDVAAVIAAATQTEDSKTTSSQDITPGAALPQITYLETPTPSIESTSSLSELGDVEMSDTSSVLSTDDYRARGRLRAPSERSETDLDLKTPTAPGKANGQAPGQQNRDTPIPELSEKRDTPVPPELI